MNRGSTRRWFRALDQPHLGPPALQVEPRTAPWRQFDGELRALADRGATWSRRGQPGEGRAAGPTASSGTGLRVWRWCDGSSRLPWSLVSSDGELGRPRGEHAAEQAVEARHRVVDWQMPQRPCAARSVRKVSQSVKRCRAAMAAEIAAGGRGRDRSRRLAGARREVLAGHVPGHRPPAARSSRSRRRSGRPRAPPRWSPSRAARPSRAAAR